MKSDASVIFLEPGSDLAACLLGVPALKFTTAPFHRTSRRSSYRIHRQHPIRTIEILTGRLGRTTHEKDRSHYQTVQAR